jgi:hypothetical protein
MIEAGWWSAGQSLDTQRDWNTQADMMTVIVYHFCILCCVKSKSRIKAVGIPTVAPRHVVVVDCNESAKLINRIRSWWLNRMPQAESNSTKRDLRGNENFNKLILNANALTLFAISQAMHLTSSDLALAIVMPTIMPRHMF